MKRCPTCNKTFTDRNLSFCIDDGTPLVPVEDPQDEVTVVSPSTGDAASHGSGQAAAGGGATIPPYQPPRAYAPPGIPPPKRRVWPWILGLLLLLVLVIVGMATVAWFYLQPFKYITANTNNSNLNVNVNRSRNDNGTLNNLNSNQNANQNVNDNTSASEDTPPPTDEAAVLASLTNLEHEWTVANINADKKKLNRILADDYVGTSPEGRSQGKAEYLRTIERDTAIEHWEFDDLTVSLKGDRAALTGIIRFKIQGQDVAYRFVDKFVWRDGRWQATDSEVKKLEET